MRILDILTAEQLLAVTAPERLFTGSINEAKQEYHTLVHRWHPDVCTTPEGALVFAHLSNLFNCAREKLTAGTWVEPPERIDEEQPGRRKYRDARTSLVQSFEYKVSKAFELGRMFIAENFVLYEVQHDYDDLFKNAMHTISKLKFESHEMAAEMTPCLPQIVDAFDAIEANILILRKTPDQVLLADLLQHLGGRLDQPEHAGWILNCVLNIACYLRYADLTHNAVSAEALFISPLRHSAMLLGGWWFSQTAGRPLKALPEKLIDQMASSVLDTGVATSENDLTLIRALGRTLFGDLSGSSLDADPAVPRSLAVWLTSASPGDALDDYAEFKYSVLPECFGTPSFVTLDVTPALIYKEK